MNPTPSGTNEPNHGKDDGMLEKLARIIDPSGREISDEELSDPGTYVHDTDDEIPPPPPKAPDVK